MLMVKFHILILCLNNIIIDISAFFFRFRRGNNMNEMLKKEDKTLEQTLKKFLDRIIDEIDFQRKNQEDIAKIVGISPGTLSKNLTGKN